MTLAPEFVNVLIGALGFLIAVVWNTLRERLRQIETAHERANKAHEDKFRHIEDTKIAQLERAGGDVSRAIGELSSKIVQQFGELRLQFVAAHPTKADLEAAIGAQSKRLDQIEDELRSIADTLGGGRFRHRRGALSVGRRE